LQNSQVESRGRRKKHPPRREYKQSRPELALRGPDGRTCLDPGKPASKWLRFFSPDGTSIIHSTQAMRRAGLCPHCCVDSLVEHGFIAAITGDTFACIERDGIESTATRLAHWLLLVGIPTDGPAALLSDWGRA
jgi:hypothetical protein